MDQAKIVSIIQGIAGSVGAALVTFGVLDAQKVSVLAGVVVSIAPLVAALFVHSIRPSNSNTSTDVPSDAPTETPSGE